jgi:hypothetical protein
MTYSLGYTPRLVYRGSEKGPFNLLFLAPCEATQLASHAEAMREHQGDTKKSILAR